MIALEKELEIHKEIKEGYTAFSAEVLKLVLLIFTAFGGLFIALIKCELKCGNFSSLFKSPSFWVTSIFLVLAGITALMHRYFANNALANLTDIKLKKDKGFNNKKVLDKLVCLRDLDFTICKVSLFIMSISFGASLVSLLFFIYNLIQLVKHV